MTMTENPTLEKLDRFAADAWAAARWVEGIDLPDNVHARPRYDIAGTERFVLDLQCTTRDAMAAAIRILKANFGKLEKRYIDSIFDVTATMPGGCMVRAWSMRNTVCEAVVVGSETVEVADPAAPKITVTRDVIEWRCEPVLAP